MAIFISYSREDSPFVDTLAANLVRAKHHIWLDRWELKLGDSLTQKIEESLTTSSAILFILSRNSVASDWCRRELNAGLVRELEEKHTIVMPVVIDDCKMPLFLRDKLYADFRNDPDAAFDLIDRSLSGISNPTMSRVESPDFHTDFSYDWKSKHVESSEETWELRFTFVDHGPNLSYSVLSECKIYQVNGSQFSKAVANGDAIVAIKRISLELCRSYESAGDENGLLDGNFGKYVAWEFRFSPDEVYFALYSYRRLGLDNGMDILVYIGNNLRMVSKHLKETVRD